MDVIDYAILERMIKLRATTKLNAATRKNIQSAMVKINIITLHRRLRKLIKNGHVATGIKRPPEHTYYVTESGINELKEAKK